MWYPLLRFIIPLTLLIASTNMKTFKQFLRENQDATQTSADYHAKFHENLKTHFPNEYDTILTAAKRNNIGDTDYDNLSMLYAIRKGEAGRRGRQFGVLSPAAMEQPGDTEEKTLDRQAGWAASSLLKNRERYEQSDKSDDFVTFMGKRWAPQGVANDPTNLNQHWAKNVSKFKETYMTCTGPNCKPGEMKPPEAPKAPEQKTQTVTPSKPAEPKAPEQQSDGEDYVVKPGDSFWKIGGSTQKGMEGVQAANPNVDPMKLKPGQTIRVPRQK
jgi:LysM repeat protein